MPLLEYECRACGKQFEVFRATDELSCPFCLSDVIRKLVSTPAWVRPGKYGKGGGYG